MNEEQTAVLATVSIYGPAPIAEIVRRTGLARRAVEASVEALRLAGHPICSGSEGVWLACDAADLADTVASLRRRTVTQYLTIRALRRALRTMQDREAGVDRPTLGLVA